MKKFGPASILHWSFSDYGRVNRKFYDKMYRLTSHTFLYFLSSIIYSNLRTVIDGFFECATIVLEMDGRPSFVPMLHSNLRVLEALFSQIHSMDRDTPERYISGLDAVNNSMRIMFLEKNKMHNPEKVRKVKGVDQVESVTRRRRQKRESFLTKWIKASLTDVEI